MNRPVCLNVTTHVDHRFGGIVTTMPRLSRAIAETGRYNSATVAFCDPEELEAHQAAAGNGLTLVPRGRKRWMTDGRLRQMLSEQVEQAAVVHIHGLWQEHCTMAAWMCRRHGKPYIVSAHGMLDQWSLKNKPWKKKVFLAVSHRRFLARAACLRALTMDEEGDYRRLGLTNPVAVVPNGIDEVPVVDPQLFRERVPEAAGQRIVLFLGRIHYKKGVEILCRAWAQLAGERGAWHLVFAGPDDEGTEARLKELVRELNLEPAVTFTGMLQGDVKWSAYYAADLFVLPSYSEGFSAAVLEALGAGCPVLISRPCHFPDVARERCGWVCEPNLESVTADLRSALTSEPAVLHEMGERGGVYVSGRYSWRAVREQAVAMLDRARGVDTSSGNR